MAKIYQHEYMFEKAIKEGSEARGWYSAHLTGPDGWPDLSLFNGPFANHVEVKIQCGRYHMREIVENTQAAFWYRNSAKFPISLCIQYDDGSIGIMRICPANALKIRNMRLADFRAKCIEYSVLDNAIKYLTTGAEW